MISLVARLLAAVLVAAVPLVPVLAADVLEQSGGEEFDDRAGEGGGLPAFDIVAGGFVGFEPEYEGSDEYRTVGYPLIYPLFADTGEPPRFMMRGIDDLRYALLRMDAFVAGPLVGWDFGRDEDDADLIDGIGDIDGGLVVGAWAGIQLAPFLIDAAYATKVTGDDTGFELRFSAGVEQPVNDRLTLSAFLSAEYVDDDYADAYFSITPAQAASSTAGLAVYDADAGFKNVAVRFGAEYELTDRWTFHSRAGYSRLIGDAGSSPVVADRNQFSGGVGLTYRFGNVNNK